MMQVVIERLVVNQYVVEEDDDELSQVQFEGVIHSGLK